MAQAMFTFIDVQATAIPGGWPGTPKFMGISWVVGLNSPQFPLGFGSKAAQNWQNAWLW